MQKTRDIIKIIEDFAPVSTQLEFDNSGLAYGNMDDDVKGILIALDVTPQVVEEAKEKGCNLIISHHPTLFNSISCFDNDNPTHLAIIYAIKYGIALYSAHTNFDFAKGGLNDEFIKSIGCKSYRSLDEKAEFARIGELEEATTLSELADKIAHVTGDNGVRFVGEADKPIKVVAGINGGGGGDIEVVKEVMKNGADVYVSGDFKYHVLRFAKDGGYAIINVNHYNSEKAFSQLVYNLITCNTKVNNINISSCCCDPYTNK